VTFSKWPGKAATSREGSELALTRLLDLELQTRRSSNLGQYEAAALLARTAVDTCITGLFCLYVPDAIGRLEQDNAKAFDSIFRYLVDTDAMSKAATSFVVGEIGVPKRIGPLDQLIKEIAESGGSNGAAQLYDRVYRPLSSMYAHGSGLALSRHVAHDDTLRKKPLFPWARRSPSHTASTCVGLLAAQIAGVDHPSYAMLDNYANWHWRRVTPVVASLSLKGALKSCHWTELPRARRALREASSFLHSPQGAEASKESKRAVVRPAVITAFTALGLEVSEEFIDSLTDMILSSGEDLVAEDGLEPDSTPD
jgi:hypothetical protein